MNKQIPSPPRWAGRLLESFCASHLLEEVQGDLQELYTGWVEEYGVRKAKWLYVWHTLKFFRPFAIKQRQATHSVNLMIMIKNYLKVGLRNMMKYRVFSFINGFGLAVAMSVGMLIMLMLADQKSYDQFHAKKDRIYRVLSKIPDSMTPNATSPVPLASTLKEDYPIIENAVHLMPGVGGDAFYEQKSTEMRGYFTDAAFFKVFSYALEKGDPRTALTTPNSIVITRELAGRLFADEEPLGKTLTFADRGLRLNRLDFGSERTSQPVDWGTFTVTGVIDSEAYKSHLVFDVLMSSASLPALYREEKVADLTNNWERYSYCHTYALLRPESTESELITSLQDIVTRHYADLEHLQGFALLSQPLTRITPGIFVGNPPSLRLPIQAYYILALLALVILLSACLNYTNLSVARALTRTKEIGVRKVNGAHRRNLLYQFMVESLLASFLALLIAHGLLLLVKPAFMELWVNQYLNFDLRESGLVYLLFVGFALLVSLVAGTYPALYLSRLSPTKAIKGEGKPRRSRLGIKKVLSVSQFGISLFFIITSLLIVRQFRHFIDFEYGFNSTNIVNIPMQGNDYNLLSRALSTVPGVSSVSASDLIPATANSNGSGLMKTEPHNEGKIFEYLRVDANFVDNLELTLSAGRNLPASGSDHLVVVNEAAVRELGYQYPSEIIGQTLETNIFAEPVEVIGVLEDFEFQTPIMADKIVPLMFINQPEHFGFLNVRVASDDLSHTVAALENQWASIDPVHPFQYYFYDDQLVSVNRWLGDLASVIGFIAFLAIVISCLGLLGMAVYTTERRTKEVGIRKVLGARGISIAVLLSRSFLKVLIVSILIAAPLSYFANNLWLQNFPNRVDFGWGTVLAGSLLLLLLGFVTIGSQTLRVARRNPVDTLRNE